MLEATQAISPAWTAEAIVIINRPLDIDTPGSLDVKSWLFLNHWKLAGGLASAWQEKVTEAFSGIVALAGPWVILGTSIKQTNQDHNNIAGVFGWCGTSLFTSDSSVIVCLVHMILFLLLATYTTTNLLTEHIQVSCWWGYSNTVGGCTSIVTSTESCCWGNSQCCRALNNSTIVKWPKNLK